MTREIIDNILKHNNIFTNSHCYDLKEFHVKEKKIKQDLLVAYIAMNASQGEKLPQVEGASDFRGISITLNLGGIFCFENNHVFERSLPNSTNILYSPKMQGNTRFENRSHTSISLMIKDQFLGQDFLEQLRIDPEKDNVLKNSPTHPMTWICFRDLIDSPYEGVLGDMFTESKILEIVTNEFSSMLSSHNRPWSSDGIPLTFQDIKALKKARQILLEKIDNPPSIRKLARMVATNEYKLKAGFKQLFGITPYALLRNHRMKTAKRLLESSEYNVAEISRMVGIKNQAHFTRAFFSWYKVLPREIMKTRKYFFQAKTKYSHLKDKKS